MSLEAFLNPAATTNTKVVVSERFVENGKPVEWEIKAITAAEDEELRKKSTVKSSGKDRGIVINDIDFELYTTKLAAACTVYPDLQNADLQNAYHAVGEEDLLKKMLTSGEFVNFSRFVQRFNGFDKSLDDFVDEAKN